MSELERFDGKFVVHSNDDTTEDMALDYIRTSVDHGTALELAGSGQADPGSLFVAVEQAIEMAERVSQQG